jgi:hypothetical protein
MFLDLFRIIEDALIRRWSSRGRKPQMGCGDAFFMTFLYLRNYSSYLTLGRAFGCKECVALDTINRVLGAIHKPLLEALVVPLEKYDQHLAGTRVFNMNRDSVRAISTGGTHCGLHLSDKLSHWGNL